MYQAQIRYLACIDKLWTEMRTASGLHCMVCIAKQNKQQDNRVFKILLVASHLILRDLLQRSRNADAIVALVTHDASDNNTIKVSPSPLGLAAASCLTAALLLCLGR